MHFNNMKRRSGPNYFLTVILAVGIFLCLASPFVFRQGFSGMVQIKESGGRGRVVSNQLTINREQGK